MKFAMTLLVTIMHRNNRAHPITDRGQGSVSDPILNVDDGSASFSVFSVACNMGIPFDFVFGFFYFVFQPSFSESQEIWLFFLAHLSHVTILFDNDQHIP